MNNRIEFFLGKKIINKKIVELIKELNIDNVRFLETQIPIIITKKDCDRCKALKEWLKKNDVKYAEKDVEDKEFTQQLTQDKNFLATFCNSESCVVKTPVVIHKGKYWFKELWGVNGLREKEAKKLFNVK